VLEKEDSCKRIANSVMETVLADDYSDFTEDDMTILVLKRT
jgi:serine phosphatase RsbU (regulator of sigma subunit)